LNGIELKIDEFLLTNRSKTSRHDSPPE